ncbi:MAG: hypothetical protein PUC76_05095 [Clostridia bacterium]|nr:hypothetical protein [Clostridia bacterium]
MNFEEEMKRLQQLMQIEADELSALLQSDLTEDERLDDSAAAHS